MEKDMHNHYTDGALEIRSDGDKKDYIQGYALIFDSMSEDMGFREIIRSGALDNTDMSDVIFCLNHDVSMVLARNNKSDGVGALKLTVDSKGLFFEAQPTNTTYARDLVENIRNGVLSKCSFRFSLDYEDQSSQSWDWDRDGKRGYDLRTINKIKKIRDVSIVTFPAYESSVANTYIRAKENYQAEINEAEKLKNEKEKLLIELM